MSRRAQWIVFALSVPAAFALYLALQVATGIDDELVIFRLLPLYAWLGLFGLTGIACLWATSPARLTRLGRAVPMFPLPSLLLILPILAIPSLRRSTRLVRTAAVNALIWSSLIAVFLAYRYVHLRPEVDADAVMDPVRNAFVLTHLTDPTPERPAQCARAREALARARREHPDFAFPVMAPTPLCDPEMLRLEAALLAAAASDPTARPAACHAAVDALLAAERTRPGVYLSTGGCAPYE